jgi:hypothetical protein
VDSNLHREHILPSEKAFAYKLKMEAMKHQGRTSGQLGPKLTAEAIADGESGIDAIMAEEKPNQRERLSLPMDRLRPYFPDDYTPKKMQSEIMGMVRENFRPQKKPHDRGDAR